MAKAKIQRKAYNSNIQHLVAIIAIFVSEWYNIFVSKRVAEADGGPFPPVLGRTPTEAEKRTAELKYAGIKRQRRRKARAGRSAAARSAAEGKSLRDRIQETMRAIHRTR